MVEPTQSADERPDLPTYRDFILPTLRAVDALGGSAKASEITSRLLEELDIDEDLLAITYESRPEKSVVIDRMDWARSYAKLGGALDSPQRGLFLINPLGKEILALPEAEAVRRCIELDRGVREDRRRSQVAAGADDDLEPTPAGVVDDEEDEDWKDVLLRRLHALSPPGFEEFVIYLLKSYGLELTRIGGSGDEGIDGIGLAPLSDVLSSRVAVQAKRYEPSSAVPRDAVALFQRDAAAAGAERAVFVTLARFTEPARRAATLATPTVNLIDGSRLCDLVLKKEIGVRIRPEVDIKWFDRFE